jgi:hypothetical protein
MRFVALDVIVPPAGVPVTQQEFVDHARLNGLTVDNQPDLIDRELAAATARGEQYCRRSFMTQTLSGLYLPDDSDSASALALVLPRGKVQAVTSITSDGAAVTDYVLEWNTIKLASPLPGSAAVLWDSGYGDAASVPAGIKDGILEYATVLYENRMGTRESKTSGRPLNSQGVPDGIRDLWRPFQIEIGG